MTEDKKIEQMIAYGYKEITISKEKYEKLRTETKNLIKLNDVKLNFEEEKHFSRKKSNNREISKYAYRCA